MLHGDVIYTNIVHSSAMHSTAPAWPSICTCRTQQLLNHPPVSVGQKYETTATCV